MVESLESRCMFAAIQLTASEQLLIELINRARNDPAGEAARLGSNFALNSGTCDGVAPNISAAAKQPLAPHQALITASGRHADDMLARDYFSHTTMGGNQGPSDRARKEGYPGGAGENISTYRQWPNDFTEQEKINRVYDRHKSLYESVCHRINMFRETWEDIGTGVRFGDYTTPERTWKAIMVVENFGSAVGGQITGVVYDERKVVDVNPMHADATLYNVGEGVDGVTITVRNANGDIVAQEKSGPSGGYTLAAPPGVYTVTASGGSLRTPWTIRNVSHGLSAFSNTKVDFELSRAPIGPSPEPDNVGVARLLNGAYRWYLDASGNGVYDGAAGVDLALPRFGLAGDIPVTGDWNGDGKDEIGVVRPINGALRWYLDVSGDGWYGAGDRSMGPFGWAADVPLVGDWNGDGKDEIGVSRIVNGSRVYYLDYSGDGRYASTADRALGTFGYGTDRPIVGDWDGDGDDELGVYRPRSQQFIFDINGNGRWTPGVDRIKGVFGADGAVPVTGDWNGDGVTEIGTFESSIWRRDVNNNGALGAGDASSRFGVASDIPIVGNWRTSLLADSGAVSAGAGVAEITTADLAPIVNQAVVLLNGTGLNSEQQSLLANVQVAVVDLPRAELGSAGGHSILLDGNAAGYGWFVDASPNRNEEYIPRHDGVWTARKGSASEGRMDLLSVVLHELSHILGYGHDEDGMLETLAVGVRRLPGPVDAVFGDGGWDR